MPSATIRGYEYPVAGDPLGDGAAKVQELAETIEAQLQTIQSGVATSASIANNAGGDITVTFPTAFVGTPNVIAIPLWNSNQQGLEVWVKTRTTTGAVIRVHNTTGSATAVGIMWIAQG